MKQSRRFAAVERKTKETLVSIRLDIDSTKDKREIDTPTLFLNHMLDLFGKHGAFDLAVIAKNVLVADEHHVVEDIGIVLGTAFREVIGEKRGINRYGFFILPLDEALSTVSLDFSGRPYFDMQCNFTRDTVGDLSTELVYDFWQAFAVNAQINLLIQTTGRNDHHKIESMFKCVARSMRMAVQIDPKSNYQIPSTKGSL